MRRERERAEYGAYCSLQTSIQAGAMQLCCDQTQTVPTSFYYKYFNFYSHKNACRCFMFYLVCCTGIKQSGGGWSYCLCLGSVTPSQYPALGCVWRLQSVMICSTAGRLQGTNKWADRKHKWIYLSPHEFLNHSMSRIASAGCLVIRVLQAPHASQPGPQSGPKFRKKILQPMYFTACHTIDRDESCTS